MQALFWECKRAAAGGGGDVLWGNMFFVDPVLGNNATAKPGSLKFTYKDLQPALDAAAAAIVPGAPVATVVPLPGRHVTPVSLVWPNKSGVHVLGLDDINTEITVTAGVPLFVSPLAGIDVASFVGSITGVRMVDLNKGAISLECTGAAIGDGQFTLENVGLSSSAVFVGFGFVEGRDTYDLLASSGGYSFEDCLTARLFFVRHNSCGFNSNPMQPTNLALIQSRFAEATVGGAGGAGSQVNVIIDVASEIETFGFTPAGPNFGLHAQGNLGLVGMQLPAFQAGQVIDIDGSMWRHLYVLQQGAAVGPTCPVSARGCQRIGNEANVINAAAPTGSISIDVRGLAGVLLDTEIAIGNNCTCDRDWFGYSSTTFEPSAAPATFNVPFPDTGAGDEYSVEITVRDTSGASAHPVCLNAQAGNSYDVSIGPHPLNPVTIITQARRRAS